MVRKPKHNVDASEIQCFFLLHPLIFTHWSPWVSSSFWTSSLFPTYLGKNCYFLKALKVFILFYLPHLVMTSAFGRMPLPLFPCLLSLLLHIRTSLSLTAIDRVEAFSLQPRAFKSVSAPYKGFTLVTALFSFFSTCCFVLIYFPSANQGISLH